MHTIPAAAVLAGGTSRRFGSDKTLALFRGKPLVSHVAEGASRYAQEVFIVAKEIEKYAFLDIKRITDIYREQCLLAGIITALESIPNGFVFVIAADMPLFPFAALPKMARLAEGFDAVVPLIDSVPCPCAALYQKSAGNIFLEFFKTGDYKIIHSLSKLRVNYIDENFFSDYCDSPRDVRRAFMNINTTEDLASLIADDADVDAFHLPHGGIPRS